MYSFFIAVKSYNFFMYVYIEYAILDNLIINYLLIKSACACAKVKTKFILLFLSSLLGTIIAKFIKGETLTKVFGGFLVVLGVLQLILGFKEEKKTN